LPKVNLKSNNLRAPVNDKFPFEVVNESNEMVAFDLAVNMLAANLIELLLISS